MKLNKMQKQQLKKSVKNTNVYVNTLLKSIKRELSKKCPDDGYLNEKISALNNNASSMARDKRKLFFG